nr:EAL domain-containing protein [Halomonas korlensis]
MGAGVWTMHFIGMMAFRLPLEEVYFDPGMTLLSVLPAVIAGYIALTVVEQPAPRASAILIGGALMGSGIGAMHYLGMSGMHVEARMLYEPSLFALSVIIAIVMSSAALSVPRLMTALTSEHPFRSEGLAFKLISASLMGLAISSLHYVAMSATLFLPVDQPSTTIPAQPLDETLIATLAVIASVFLLVISTLTVIFRFRLIAVDKVAEASVKEARRLEDRFSKIVSRLPGMVYQFQLAPDGHMSFPYASDAIQPLFGLPPESVKKDATPILQLTHPEDLNGVLASISESADTLNGWRHEYRIRLGQRERWLQGNAVPEQLADGSTLWNGFITDVSEQKQYEARIHELAFYDELTGLPNRRLLKDRIELALAASHRHRQYGALLFLDLDDFKSLNDTLGHSFGDELLKILAGILTGRLRDLDTIARLGGDEFVIVIGEIGTEQKQAAQHAGLFAEELLRLITEPMNLKGYRYRCAASIGITLFSGAEQTSEELLRRADTAMYEAKSAGRGMIRFHDPQTQSILARRFRLETEFRQAMERKELCLDYQKQVDRRGHCVSVEALLRWQHPEQGLIPPQEFIPIAEDSGLIIPLGQWVMEMACRQLAIWQAQPSTRRLKVSINVSARQFLQSDFVEQVMDTIHHSGAHPEGLCLELTESLVLADLDDALIKMQAFRKQGIQLSMDDFGTGYSSMAYLSRLPFDEVKIDKSFVQQTGENHSGNEWIIIEAIINMAHNLGMRVVAEGVETENQHHLLGQLGCDCFQGYYLGRPVDLSSLDLSLSREIPA